MNDNLKIKKLINVSAIILAGGKSKRMGQDKSDLLFLGKSLLNNQIDKIKSLGIEDIVVSGYKGNNCDEKIVLDEGLSIGPLSGLSTAFKYVKNDKVLVISVDVPLVPIEHLKQLIDVSLNNDKDAIITYHNGHDEPLIAVYNRRVLNIWCSTENFLLILISVSDLNSFFSCHNRLNSVFYF